MYTGIYQTMLTLAVIVVFYTIDTYYMTLFDKERQAPGSGRSYSYTFIISLMILFLAAQPIFLPQVSVAIPGPVGLSMQALGLVLIIMAISLHIWSRIHLRQYYAERVEVQPRHTLVKTGPYHFVRHPVITSFFIFSTGLFLTNPGLVTLFVLGFTIWDFGHSARQEEVLLSQTLPGYRSYLRETPPFFPRLHRNRGEQKIEPRS